MFGTQADTLWFSVYRCIVRTIFCGTLNCITVLLDIMLLVLMHLVCIFVFTELPARKGLKRPWSEEEKAAVDKHLAKFMALRKTPGKMECLMCIEDEPALKNRSWKDIKNFVYNTNTSLNRKMSSRSSVRDPGLC